MRTKVTLALLFLNVALFFFIFHFERQWELDGIIRESRRRVLGAETANLQAIEIAGDRLETLRLERKNDAWMLTQPLEWPANLHAVNSLINELQLLEHEASFRVAALEKSGQTLADYGLDKPQMTLTLTAASLASGDTRTLTLKVGSESRIGNRLYVLSPDGEYIHVVGRSLSDHLRLTLDQLRTDTLFTIEVFETRSLNLQTAAPANLRVRLRREGERWSFETPIIARASRERAVLAVEGLNDLRVRAFPEARQATAETTGLNAPSLRITLEGNNRRETLLLGRQLPSTPSPEGGSPAELVFYARMEDKPAVVTVAVPPLLLQTLRNAQEELRERRILDFDPRAVTAITLSAPNQPDLILQRLESGTTGGPLLWQIVRRDAAQGPQTLPAAAQAVSRLLEQLGRLSAERFFSDAPLSADLENWGFNRPERTVRLSLASGGSDARNLAHELVLQLGIANEREGSVYARLVNQPYVYLVSPDILQETPVAPRNYRERILRELSAGARITGLSLTRIADRSSLYTRQLAENETWAQALADESPERRAAIENMLDQLRVLRAKSFVLDSFPSRIAIDDEERVWSYQLDVSIALVGGNGVQTVNNTLFLTERLGGTTQWAGTPEFGGVVFETEQALLDALWVLLYGERDPGPPAAPPSATAAAARP